MMQVSLAGQIVYSTAISDVNDKLMDFCCFLLFSAISMILLKKLCQFCATGVKSSAFCINILHLQFIQLRNTTNFSTLYSVQNRFFSTMQHQYGLLSRHLFCAFVAYKQLNRAVLFTFRFNWGGHFLNRVIIQGL